MAIPDYETLMLPLLTIAGDGQEHRVSDVVDQLARDFKLAEKERQQHRHRSNRNRASPSDDQNIERANIRVTELLFRLQNALGISLVSLASFNPRYSMIVEPLFACPVRSLRASMCLSLCLSRMTCCPSIRITLSQPARA
jgi:Mrr N-terminal domain